MENTVGRTDTQFFTFGSHEEPFRFWSGEALAPVTLAYETYGKLNAARDNVILLFHAMTGSQHAAGFNPGVEGVGALWTSECRLGWWDDFIGPGKPLDTDRFCVLCANYIGGCYGSTGPASVNPATGLPYGRAFPTVMFCDIVDSQVRLLDHLGIHRLAAVVGASIGGMLCLSFATRYPDRVKVVIPIASGLSVSTLQRIQNLEQILAIESDPNFQGGAYYDGPRPDRGLALARMIAHKTFVSLSALRDRARTEIVQRDEDLSWYRIGSALESYMIHQGRKFVERFDANTYLRIVDAWQRFNLLEEARAKRVPGRANEPIETLQDLFARCQSQRYLVFTIDSDVCFFPDDQEAMARVLREAGVPHVRATVHSDKGHDSFLIEPELYKPHLYYILHDE